jgi:hypothetical protein
LLFGTTLFFPCAAALIESATMFVESSAKAIQEAFVGISDRKGDYETADQDHSGEGRDDDAAFAASP